MYIYGLTMEYTSMKSKTVLKLKWFTFMVINYPTNKRLQLPSSYDSFWKHKTSPLTSHGKAQTFFILFLTIHPIFFSIMSTKEQPISNVFFINQTYICKILRHEYVGGEHYLLLNPG